MTTQPEAELRRTLLELAAESGFDRHPLVARRHRRIYRSGATDQALYLLQQGLVATVVTVAAARRVFTSLVQPDQVFGESCLCAGPRRADTALVLRDAVALRVPVSALLARLSDPALGATLLAYMAERTVAAQSHAVELLSCSTPQRLALLMIRLSASRNGDEWLRVTPPLTQEEWADSVGTTRSRVCTFLSHFRSLGLIEPNGDGSFRVDAGGLATLARDPASSAPGEGASHANPVDPTL